MKALKLDNRKHYEIKSPIKRQGCPSEAVPPCQISIPPSVTGKRKELTYKIVTKRLVHRAKDDRIKNSLSLEGVHLELERHSLMLHNSGSSNIILSKVSFDCLIEEETREYISFDLRIPEANSEPVFHYNLIESMYNDKTELYETLKFFYEQGRACANKEDRKHGHQPSYDPDSSRHDQYIRHTEQYLTAYLHLPQAAEMLCNRLRTEIRAKHANASRAKIYNMTLHIHSTKTCCAPCEYSLIGLTNTREHLNKNGMQLGFIPNFEKIAPTSNEQLTFRLPQKSSFQVLVTVSASSSDGHHQKQPTYAEITLGTPEETHDYIINTKEQTNKIFTTMLDTGYRTLRFPDTPNFTDKTVGISGSDSTPGSPHTKERVRSLKEAELNDCEAEICGKKYINFFDNVIFKIYFKYSPLY